MCTSIYYTILGHIFCKLYTKFILKGKHIGPSTIRSTQNTRKNGALVFLRTVPAHPTDPRASYESGHRREAVHGVLAFIWYL